MTITVRLYPKAFNDSCTDLSVMVSRAEVASSRITTGGFFNYERDGGGGGRGGGGVREEQKKIIPDQTSSNGHSLLFPATQFQSSLANLCFPILRQSLHKLFNLCLLSDSVDLLWCGSHVAVVDVVIESVIEQDGVLRDDANALTNGLLSVVADVVVPDLDLSMERIIKAEQQTRDGRLPTPTVTNNGYREEDEGRSRGGAGERTCCRSRRNKERDAFESRGWRLAWVMEDDI
jgi:hypothetical protein